MKISVRVTGVRGLEDPDRLYEVLTAETDLAWLREEPAVAPGGTLSGVTDLIFGVVMAKPAEMAWNYALEQVRRAIRRYTAEYVDPPDVTLDAYPVPDPDAVVVDDLLTED